MSKTWKVSLAALFCVGLLQLSATAQTRFSVVLNEQSNNGDSPKTVSYFDADNLGDGPLFSVFLGYEASNNFDEPGAIDVDPATGDVYVLAYDSGTAGAIDSASAAGGSPGVDGDDTEGDYDLLRINFDTVFNYWQANHQGQDVRTLGGGLAVGGPAPTAGYANGTNLDYVIYGETSPDHSLFDFAVNHSNTHVLPGSIEKIGEVKRNSGGGDFFPYSLEFIDEDTLFLIDDSKEASATDTAANDHSYRIIERVSTSPGAATGTTGDHGDGGFNVAQNTESWISRDIGLVNLDFVSGVATGHSEVESSAYYEDPLTGTRGVWVTESDGGGDDIAFLELDSSNNSLGYKEQNVGGGPVFPTSFALDNDPFVNPTTNDGKADNIFVDQDTGDLIIIEGGFGDLADGFDTVDREPAVIRREVTSYDNGLGQIEFGAWSQKVILDPNTNSTPGESSSFLERGQWAAYDSVNDLVYFWNPGNGGSESPQFGLDVWVLDIATGITTAFLDLDESVSLFQGDSFGDKTDFFTLGSTFDPADLNMDGFVDGLDLGILLGSWGTNTTPDMGELDGNPPVDGLDLGILLGAWNPPPVAAAAAVPEPTAIALFGLAGLALVSRRQRS